MKPVLKPEILIAQASKKFDAKGKLVDDKARDLIRQKLEALRVLILKERTYASINYTESTSR